ncbi:hypothetical protein [Azohydromonas aeria]|nr:hypothetical protein [Azohydromonas aeria]
MGNALEAVRPDNGWELARKRSEKIVFGTCFIIVGVNALLVIFL